MNIEKQERINTNIKTRSKNEKVSIKISFSKNRIVMTSCTTTANAQTGNTKYIYGQNDTNTTVYTLNEDGKTLTRKLKYEYKHDENGQVIEKSLSLGCLPGTVEAGLSAYRNSRKFMKSNSTTLNGTPKESTFNHNKQESIYREGNNANLLADTQNKK